jgi:hypothetical protein
MWKMFDSVMWVFSCVLGLLLTLAGSIWSLQGMNLAFNGPMGGRGPSPMVGDQHWTIYGVIAAVLGLFQLVWSIRRRPR